MGRNIKTIFIVIAIVVFNFQFSMVYADTPCQPIYGGGQTCASSANITPDKKKIAPTPAAAAKGGFPVLSPVPVYTTPSTGAESLILFSLILAGISGWLLRKHAIKI